LENEDTLQIVDLCSGAGGGAVNIKKGLEESTGKKVKITLTDKYPNKPAFDSIKRDYPEIDVIPTPVDATNVPAYLRGFRTIFTAFHHFRPSVAEAILRDAVNKGDPIGIFEFGDREPLAMMKLSVFLPIGLWSVTPSLRPFKLSRIFFTYVIPLIPLCGIWDGIISLMRIYSPHELEEMTKQNWGKNYTWKSGIAHYEKGVGKVTYLIGYPGNH
jgi:hypothetical protein